MSRIADDFASHNPNVLSEDRTSIPIARLVAAVISAPMSWYFRFQLRNPERIPAGACLLVANHNIAAPHEVLLLLRAWRQFFGDRPVRGLTHRIAWARPFRWLPILQKIGGIFAHPQVAKTALRAGHALLVFPGGDLDALRPFSARYKIGFGERSGFVGLAKETQVPIVPVVICGAHAAYFVLPGAKWIGRMLGTQRLAGFKAFPFTAGILLFVLLTPLAIFFPLLRPILLLCFLQIWIPLPTHIEAMVLEPIAADAGSPDAEIAERVRDAMQTGMDVLKASRRTPWG